MLPTRYSMLCHFLVLRIVIPSMILADDGGPKAVITLPLLILAHGQPLPGWTAQWGGKMLTIDFGDIMRHLDNWLYTGFLMVSLKSRTPCGITTD